MINTNTNQTYVVLSAELFDGTYREQAEYVKVGVELKNFTIKEDSIRIEGIDAKVKKGFLRLFTRMEDGMCLTNVTMEFTNKFGNSMNGKIIMESPLPECLPNHLSIDVDFPHDSLISTGRVMNYTILVFMSLCFFCYAMIRQIKKVEENENVAKRMSLMTIGWNIIWNFSLFNIYFSYSVLNQENTQLMAPAFFYFMICFLFELKLLLLCWKANNTRVIQEGANAARRALIFFYVKFY